MCFMSTVSQTQLTDINTTLPISFAFHIFNLENLAKTKIRIQSLHLILVGITSGENLATSVKQKKHYRTSEL